jgi:hypothetical protein
MEKENNRRRKIVNEKQTKYEREKKTMRKYKKLNSFIVWCYLHMSTIQEIITSKSAMNFDCFGRLGVI